MELQATILAAFIPGSPGEKADADAAFKEALQLRLQPNHFTGHYRFLFEVIGKQAVRKAPLDREILESYLSNSKLNDEEKTQLRILFASCKEATVDIDKLRTLIPAFIEQQGAKIFGGVITDTVKILTEGLQVGKTQLKGLDDAKQYLIKNVAGIASMTTGNSPQGNLHKSMDIFWELYTQAKENPDYGIKSGIKELDDATRGARSGELFTVAGFAKEGKSQMLRNWAYNAAIRHKKNVVYASLEMSFDQLNRLFVSLHSTHEKFGNKLGIKDFDISDGKLTPVQEDELKKVTDDYTYNTDYGIVYILQMPSGSTVSSLRNNLVYLNSLFPIDAVFLDYASLLRSDTPMATTTMQVTSVFKDLKDLALTFNDGIGIPVITAHQISRAKREAVEKTDNKRYDIGYLSDAAEVERSSDMVAWILRTEELIQAREVKMGISQFRRGRLPLDWRCREYYDCSKIESLALISGGPGVYDEL